MYHKPPDTFVSRTRLAVAKAEDLQAERAAEEGDESTGAPSTSGEAVRLLLSLIRRSSRKTPKHQPNATIRSWLALQSDILLSGLG